MANKNSQRICANDIMLGVSLLAESEFEKHGLSRRQKQVALRLLRGETAEHISRKMHLTLSCIRYHIGTIYKKTGGRNRQEFLLKVWRGMNGSQSSWKSRTALRRERSELSSLYTEWQQE